MSVPTPRDPWVLSDDHYPWNGAAAEQHAYALRWAVLAPCNHNTQPSLFSLDGDEVLLRADTTRALPACDPQLRELVISCGAALYHLRVALRHFEREGVVTLLPDPRPTCWPAWRTACPGTPADSLTRPRWGPRAWRSQRQPHRVTTARFGAPRAPIGKRHFLPVDPRRPPRAPQELLRRRMSNSRLFAQLCRR